MLQCIQITNYAIISNLEVRFSKKLTIITGETGAGKSILMGALGLALGDRADLSQMGDKNKKLIVEAIFQVEPSGNISDIMQKLEIDFDDEIIVRREIAANGKSRSFVNDTPVTLTQLQELSSLLVDLHQQFDTLQLGKKDFQRTLLDARAGCLDLMKEFSSHYTQYNLVCRMIEQIKQDMLRAEQEKEYNLFLLNELEELNWKIGEAKNLEDELNVLSNADHIRTTLSKITHILKEGEQPILSQIKNIQTSIQALGNFHSDFISIAERMSSAYLELKDLSSDLDSMTEKVVVNEKRIDEINSRLSVFQRLLKKHGIISEILLLEKRDELSVKVAAFESAQEELVQREKEKKTHFDAAMKIATSVHEKRKKHAPMLESASIELLSRIGMPNARLKIAIDKEELNPSGIDQPSFLFDANKSGHFEPLHKVASGGELSRLMLVLKSLVAGSLDMPTLIFDEIDSGISGEAARQVGILLEELADSHQLISITHQPQIAARADHHLYVYKEEKNGNINTSIKLLTHQERINAIAKMLAGENPSKAALANAKEMMD